MHRLSATPMASVILYTAKFLNGKLSRMHEIITICRKIFVVALKSQNLWGKHSWFKRLLHMVVLIFLCMVIDCSRVSAAVQVNRSVMAAHEKEFFTEGEIHGYHVYQSVWTPVINEVLQCIKW